MILASSVGCLQIFFISMEVFFLKLIYIFILFCLMAGSKIVCWNCMGISSKETYDRILSLIRTDYPSIICLVETRAIVDRVDCFCAKFSRNWE